jgi:hypothetical protein
MRLRIVRPLPRELEGFQLAHLVFGAAYDINAPLCDLLLLNGYGVPEDEPPVDRSGALKALGGAILTGGSETKPKRRLKKQ